MEKENANPENVVLEDDSQATTAVEKCTNCGTELTEGQEFCPKCGTARMKRNVCEKCGAELQEGQEFCSKCGQKVGVTVNNRVMPVNKQFSSENDIVNAKKKKTPVIIGIVIAIIAVVAIIGVKLFPKIFIDAEGYMAQGNYEKAYEKAKSDEEKEEVIAENAAAVQSAYSADNLKDPSSFSLRDAYFYEGINDDNEKCYYLTLYISGANSYGASVSSYWLYIWDTDDEEWNYWCSVSDLSNEEYSKYDDDDDKVEKFIDNTGRTYIKKCMSGGTELSKDAVQRINTMFEEDTLADVELLDVYESTSTSEESSANSTASEESSDK